VDATRLSALIAFDRSTIGDVLGYAGCRNGCWRCSPPTTGGDRAAALRYAL